MVETEIAHFELHSNYCRLFKKNNRLSEHHFHVKYKNDITEQETPHSDLPTEEFAIHEITACAKTQNIIKTMEFHMCPGNSDFSEVKKNKFADGNDLNFYDKQKNIKAETENKIFSTVEELDIIRTISFYTKIR